MGSLALEALSSDLDRQAYPKGPCSYIAYTSGPKVPIHLLQGSSIYYVATWTLRVKFHISKHRALHSSP